MFNSSNLRSYYPANLTQVNTSHFQPIPVLSRSRGEDEQDNNKVSILEDDNNNKLVKSEKSGEIPKKRCSMCLSGKMFSIQDYLKHLKEHYSLLFKCKICKLGFEEWKGVVRHIGKYHTAALTNVESQVSFPANSRRLLLAKCRVRRCRRQFLAMTEVEMEQHFLMEHWGYRKKVAEGVDWSCRLCNNGNRRFRGWEDAISHAEMHHAGLLVTSKDVESESDTSSGGFSSGDDCLSSEEGDSELSTVSERGTEDSEEAKSDTEAADIILT